MLYLRGNSLTLASDMIMIYCKTILTIVDSSVA